MELTLKRCAASLNAKHTCFSPLPLVAARKGMFNVTKQKKKQLKEN